MSDLQKLLQRLDDAGIDFVLVGGYAAMLHGSSLLTRDVDVCATLTPETIERAVTAAGRMSMSRRPRCVGRCAALVDARLGARSRLHVPLLLIAGEQDQHATLEQSRALYEAANEPKQFWGVAGAAHVDLHAYAKAEYERRVPAFLASSVRKADVQATARSIPSAATSTMKSISSGVMQYGGMK